MTEKKRSSSSDALYMTDDLAGRLDPESLTKEPEPIAKIVPGGRAILGTETEEEVIAREKLLAEALYDHSPANVKPVGIPTTVEFSFGTKDGKLEFDCTLRLVSFGKKGWRVEVDDADPKICVKLTQMAARHGVHWIDGVRLHGIVKLFQNVDATVHFGGLDDTCSVSIAADEGDAI